MMFGLTTWRCLPLLQLLFFLLLRGASAQEKLANRTIERTVQLRTHSIFAPYIDQDLQNRWWDFGADSYVNTNKHIRLTRPVRSQMGWLWSRLPVTAANFVVEVEFKVSGESGHLFGDGLAVWLTKSRAEPGPVFGSRDKFEGLGIFLDTYANARHGYSFPRITGMLGDGMTSYDQQNDGDANSIGGCSANFRRTNVATKLKITYVRDTYLDVKIQYKAWDDWSDCFTVTGISLPLSPYLGFSAVTGDVFDAHDIITVTTFSAILSAENAQRDTLSDTGLFRRKGKGGGGGSWMGFFFKLFLFAGVCAGGWYGWQEYQRRGGRYGGNFSLGGGGFGGGRGGGFSYSNAKRF